MNYPDFLVRLYYCINSNSITPNAKTYHEKKISYLVSAQVFIDVRVSVWNCTTLFLGSFLHARPHTNYFPWVNPLKPPTKPKKL